VYTRTRNEYILSPFKFQADKAKEISFEIFRTFCFSSVACPSADNSPSQQNASEHVTLSPKLRTHQFWY